MIYILAFMVTLIAAVAMAVGVIIGGKPLRGSCGGLNCSNCTRQNDCRYKPRKA